MSVTPAELHLIASVMLFWACYVLTTSRQIWYFSCALFMLNMSLAAMYIVVDAMTGAGFNEAALYYLMKASWRDLGLLWAYEAVRYGLPLMLLLVLFGLWFARRLPLPGLLKISRAAQLILVVSTSAFSFYTMPLAADFAYTLRASGLDKRDHIGLQKILSRMDRPEKLPGPYKNLIVLYVESLEAAFLDEQLFPGLMPRLNRLAEQGVRFDRIAQSPMSDWTIAGMIATQCGVPLSSHRMLNEPNNFDKFSIGYPCLPKHLSHQDYTQVYMGGASNDFAGKGDYYRSVGVDEVLGLEQLTRSDSALSPWGLYDAELLKRVQEKVHLLSESSQKPFALFALTLDMHPPAGFPSPTCVEREIRSLQAPGRHFDAIRCTDEVVGRFLEQLLSENLKNTTVVMLSDHVMMNSQAHQVLQAKRVPRLNQMVIWDKDLDPRRIGRQASQFDVAPTILHALTGRSYQVGFGTSLLDNRPNLTEQYGSSVFNESVYAWRIESWRKW